MRVEAWENVVFLSPKWSQYILDFCTQRSSSYSKASLSSLLSFSSSFNRPGVEPEAESFWTPSSLLIISFSLQKYSQTYLYSSLEEILKGSLM